MDQPVASHKQLVTEVVTGASLTGPANIASLTDRAAREAPERPALIVIDEVVTYAGLQEAKLTSAGTLRDAGVGPGDRVALVQWGGLAAVAGTLACAHLGAAAAAMNPLLTETEQAQLREIAKCIDVEVPSAVCPREAVVAPPVVGGGSDDALVLFTSGTTGLPKAVPITHDSVFKRVAAYRAPFSADRPAAVSIMCVPVFHVGGLLGLLLNLYSGETTVIQPRFDAGQWIELVQHHRVTSGFLVPTMLQRILDHPDFAGADLSSLTSIAYGAAAAPRALIQRAMRALPEVSFANVFGQTETLGAYTTLSPGDHHDSRRIGSVGRPLPGVHVRIVDPATTLEVSEPGITGELWVLSEQNVPSDRTNEDGWLHTGDLAYRDADGYLFPTGRMSDTINRGGEKFGPSEISDVLRLHPDVTDVIVAGVPDEEMGERVGVAVVGRRPLTIEELREWCRQSLAAYKLPEIVVNVEALPYNELGKLTRRAAAELISSQGANPTEAK